MSGIGISIPNAALFRGARRRVPQEASDLIRRMTVEPSPARIVLIANLVRSLVSGGVWSHLDALYVLAAHDAQAARLNWVADQHTLTAVNSPAFAVDGGYTGNGTSSYLSTGMVASTLNASGKMKQNSLTMGAFVLSEVNALQAVVGSTSGGADALFLIPKYTNNQVRGAAYSGGGNGVSAATTIEQFSISRTNSTAFELRRGGVTVSTVPLASSPPGADAIDVLRGVGTYFAGAVGAAFVGGYLTAAQDLVLRDALRAYLVGIGRLS